MLYKNYSFAEKLWKIPFRLVLDGISALQQLFGGDKAYVGIVLKAHLAFYKWILSGKDKRFFPKKRMAHPHGIYKGSVVWKYFVQKKRSFTEIIG